MEGTAAAGGVPGLTAAEGLSPSSLGCLREEGSEGDVWALASEGPAVATETSCPRLGVTGLANEVQIERTRANKPRTRDETAPAGLRTNRIRQRIGDGLVEPVCIANVAGTNGRWGGKLSRGMDPTS